MMNLALIAAAVLSSGVVVVNEIPDQKNLEWQVRHSSNVIRVQILRTVPIELHGQDCGIVWEVKTIQSFKGRAEPGKVMRVWGPNDVNYWQVGSDRLMFLRKYDGERHSACTRHIFSKFLQVHWSCCGIDGDGDNAQVMFETLLSSESRGPDIPVPATTVFQFLRQVK